MNKTVRIAILLFFVGLTLAPAAMVHGAPGDSNTDAKTPAMTEAEKAEKAEAHKAHL